MKDWDAFDAYLPMNYSLEFRDGEVLCKRGGAEYRWFQGDGDYSFLCD